MPGLCQYASLFGEPGKGAHAPRLFGLATVDLLGTALISYLVAGPLMHWGLIGGIIVFILFFALAVVLHEAFHVNSRFTASLFGRPWPGPYPACPCGPGSKN